MSIDISTLPNVFEGEVFDTRKFQYGDPGDRRDAVSLKVIANNDVYEFALFHNDAKGVGNEHVGRKVAIAGVWQANHYMNAKGEKKVRPQLSVRAVRWM